MADRRRRSLELDQGGSRRSLAGRTGRQDAGISSGGGGGGGSLRKPQGAPRGRDNAPSRPFCSPRFQHQQQQRRTPPAQQEQQQAPQPLARHYDAMLLHSLSAAVAAAGQSGSCWLDAASDGEEVSSAVQLPSPTAADGRGAAPALLHTPVGAAAGSRPGSPGLLLPHLQSAGAEDCSWLMSSSPVASPDHASSPSLAFSASLSHSISLGAASEHTGVSSGAPRAALPAVKARSPAGAAAPPPGSLEGSAPPGTPPAGSPPAAAVAEAAEPGSPVTLQPPPESQHAAAAEAAASGGWWSPGQSVARLAPPAGAEALSTGLEGSPQSLSPLAAALPPGQAAREGETPPAGGRRRARRRHSSPFLARDCSEVDVFCPDRYSLWTQRQQDGAGGQPHTTLQRPASAGAAIGRPASAAARQPPHWQAYATSLEDAELGMGHDAAAGSPPEVAASGGRRLRHAFSSMLRWVSGKLQSHPIELTPSELAYSSCHSSPEVSPHQWELQGSGRGSSPGSSRFATPGSGGGGGGDWRRSRSGNPAVVAAAAAAGMPRRHLCYGGAGEPGGGSSCGSEGSCSVSPGSAGAPSGHDSGHLMATAATAAPQAGGGEAAGSPAGSSSSTVVLAGEDSLGPAEGSQGSGVATEDSSMSNYQTPRSCSPCSTSSAAAPGAGCSWRGGRASSVGSC